jgi:hypothetical protein
VSTLTAFNSANSPMLISLSIVYLELLAVILGKSLYFGNSR